MDITPPSNEKGILSDDFVTSSPETDVTIPDHAAELKLITDMQKHLRLLKRHHRRAKLTSGDDSDLSSDEEEITDSENEYLIPTPKRLTWAQWQRIRKLEDEIEDEKQWDKVKKKLITLKARKKLSKRHVLDVVADKGDYVMPSQCSIEGYPVPGRIRINSPLIVNALNEILNLALREPCILVHPFKILIDHEQKMRQYLDKLKELATRTNSMTDDLQVSANIDHPIHSPIIGSGNLKTVPQDLVKHGVYHGKASKNQPSDTEKLEHFLCLIEVMDTNLLSELASVRNIKNGSAKTILFSHLWHLFPPGELIYCQSSDAEKLPQVYRVLHVSGGRPRISNRAFPWFFPDEVNVRYASKISPFHLNCMYVDFDGKHFRPVQTDFDIAAFSGPRPINGLQVYPFRFLDPDQRSEIENALSSRGKTFFELALPTATHKEYLGLSLGPQEREEINSRVIVDFAEAVNFTSSLEREKADSGPVVYKYRGIRSKSEEEKKPRFGLGFYSTTDVREWADVTEEELADPTYFDDNLYDMEKTDGLVNENCILKGPAYEIDRKDMKEEDHILLPGYVYAYVLRLRKWCKCDVSIIKDVHLDASGFDKLVLPEANRKLMKALVQTHTRGPRPVDAADEPHAEEAVPDLVRGKGKGLIILLHGAPGTGKTSTAETIADATGRPLLPVTCGDMGETAQDLEINFERLFTLAHRWGCVLLLDEADVFLAQRDPTDMRRNAVVSVFLRVLEYYSGILFLTTNRPGAIDEGFKSRIHVSLEYPTLDWKTTKRIWQTNMKRVGDRVDVEEKPILRFANEHFKNDPNITWNGRQIFNAFQTAVAMAEDDHKKNHEEHSRTTITVRHFRKIAEISDNFENYLQSICDGMTSSDIALQNRVRGDGIRSRSVESHSPDKPRRRSGRASDKREYITGSSRTVKKTKNIYESDDSVSFISSDTKQGRKHHTRNHHSDGTSGSDVEAAAED